MGVLNASVLGCELYIGYRGCVANSSSSSSKVVES